MTLTSFDEAMRQSEEEFFEAIDKASRVLTVREIAETIGTSISSAQCWVEHTRAPHPVLRGMFLEKINKLLADKVDSP